MHRLIQRLVVLSVLVGALMYLTLPRIVRADIHECDSALFNEIGYCGGLYFVCVENNFENPDPQDCDALMRACLAPAYGPFYTCISEAFNNPRPLPVINEARSECFSTCQGLCSGIENLGERTECLNPCLDFCEDTYPRQ